MPPIVWVLDVIEYRKKYYVLECNIFNASNYYDCDRNSIVLAVEKALRGFIIFAELNRFYKKVKN